MRTLQMAGRNVLRAKRRSAITAGAMALAYGLMIVFSALWDGLLNDFRRNASLMDTGHVQLHARGYLAKPSLYDRVEDPGGVVAALRAKGYRASPRLFAACNAGRTLRAGVFRSITGRGRTPASTPSRANSMVYPRCISLQTALSGFRRTCLG